MSEPVAKAPQTESVRERLFRQRTVKYNGVAIEVRPLPFHRIPDLIESLKALWPVFTGQGLKIEEVMDDVVNLMRECVTVPADDSITVEDLPAGVFPDLIGIFMEQSLHPGKWIGLAGKARLTVEAEEEQRP